MTRVRFVRHNTFRTKSDHLALFVVVELIQRRFGKVRRRTRLKLCTANAGGHFDADDLERLLSRAPDVLALQECSDQSYVVEVAAEHGYQVLDGEGGGQPGQKATPTLIGPRVQSLGPTVWVQLLGAVPIGPGAGPDRSKPKWWLRDRLAVDGIRFSASSWHATASQQNKPRFLAALAETRVWVEIATTLRRPVFTLGDTNSDYSQRLTRWILAHQMTSNHEQLGELATEGGRSIDAVAVQSRLVLAA